MPNSQVTTPDEIGLKISVVLPSYRNPVGMMAIVTNLYSLANKPERLEFNIGLDRDDESYRYVHSMPIKNVHVTFYEHDIVHPDMWNVICKEHPASIHMLANDNLICLKRGWDDILERACTEKYIVFWNDVGNPNAAGSMAVTDKWLQACEYAQPPYFPFWFSDTWMDELRTFVDGKAVNIEKELQYVLPPHFTTGMRDVDYWWGFFNCTRPLRITKAWDIYKKLGCTGLTEEEFRRRALELRTQMRWRDWVHRHKISQIEAGCEEVPEKKLVRLAQCREIAESMMKEHNLELWGDL